jgi:hypothetical protein
MLKVRTVHIKSPELLIDTSTRLTSRTRFLQSYNRVVKLSA